MDESKEETKSFKELGVCDQLIESWDNLGWKYPSKIQAEAMPHAFEGFSVFPSLCSFIFSLPHVAVDLAFC